MPFLIWPGWTAIALGRMGRGAWFSAVAFGWLSVLGGFLALAGAGAADTQLLETVNRVGALAFFVLSAVTLYGIQWNRRA